MNRLLLTLSILLSIVFTSCHRTYYDDTVRTPRGRNDYRDSFSAKGYQKHKTRSGDSYGTGRAPKRNQEFSDSYSVKSKRGSGSKFKDTYTSGNGKKRRLKFYDSFSSKKRKNIFLAK